MPNELHTMPLMLEKLLSSRRVACLKLDEFGAYMKLLGMAWLEGARLPSDLEELRESLGKGSEDSDAWRRIAKFVIERFFRPSDDGKYLYNETQVELYHRVVSEISARSNQGKLAANKRWGDSKTSITEVVPEQCRSNADALQTHCRPNAIQSQSQSQRENIRTPKPPGGDGWVVPDNLKSLEGFNEAWAKWVPFRRKMKACKDFKTMFQGQLDKLARYPDMAVSVIEKSIMNGYQGLIFNDVPKRPAKQDRSADPPTTAAQKPKPRCRYCRKDVDSVNEDEFCESCVAKRADAQKRMDEHLKMREGGNAGR